MTTRYTSKDFRFSVCGLIKGQIVFTNTTAPAPINFKQQIVGWALLFVNAGRQPKQQPYFKLTVKGGSLDTFTLTNDFKIFNSVGITDSSGQIIYENDFLFDKEDKKIGCVEFLCGKFYFLPNDRTNLTRTGRKCLTDSSNWVIVGNSIDGLIGKTC